MEKGKKMNEWIPVVEQMPEDGSWALWCSDKGIIQVARFKMDAVDHFYPGGELFDLEDAVAWMPLPEPYVDEIEVGKQYPATDFNVEEELKDGKLYFAIVRNEGGNDEAD
jgi:hypothetical protein